MNFETKEVFKQAPDEAMRAVGNNEKFSPTYNAPTVVLVSGLNNSPYKDSDWAAAPTLLFMGAKNEEFRTRLNIPENYTPLIAVLLGYSDHTPSKAPKRKENAVQYVR